MTAAAAATATQVGVGIQAKRMTMTVGLRFLRQVGHIGFTKTSKRDH